MAKYKRITAPKGGWSDWVAPVMKGYRLGCCDCSLVHEMEFAIFRVTSRQKDGEWYGHRVPGHKVKFRMRRHGRATSAARRHQHRSGS